MCLYYFASIFVLLYMWCLLQKSCIETSIVLFIKKTLTYVLIVLMHFTIYGIVWNFFFLINIEHQKVVKSIESWTLKVW